MKNVKFQATALLTTCMLLMLTVCPARAGESYFYKGTGGQGASFYLIGGQYTLYVYAKRPILGYYASESKQCIFGGNFQRTWPTHDAMSLGAGITLSTIVPHKIGPLPIALPAGLYQLYIPPLTSCDWKFILSSTNQNTAGIAPVTMLRQLAGREQVSVTTSLSDQVQFYAQYRSEHDDNVLVSGTMQIVHDGQVVRTLPLRRGLDRESLASAVAADVKWEAGDAKFLGKNTVNFIVKIGSAEFTSTGEFTLTQ